MDNTEWERIFNAIPDMIALIGPDHTIQKMNRAMAENLGIPLKKAIGTHCDELVHGTSGPVLACPHTALIRDNMDHTADIYNELSGITG
ncbi:PAS domain-containing protein [uncultured Methanospirillum sp.]|uniref:PAS domain-containing protein n=1 Tax=uncultured Methanospirillum sp. TaxID=262503 RepID=UPI0029C92AFA|nr:PAS domain-containing protein [uncultured Methanospirillum sp.]